MSCAAVIQPSSVIPIAAANIRFELDPRWSDTGDRYILKLFRDYVFHSISVDGSPILDLSHVLTCLNKVGLTCVPTERAGLARPLRQIQTHHLEALSADNSSIPG